GDGPPDLSRPHLLWVERNDVRIRIAYAASLALLFGLPGVLNYYIVPLVLCWHTSLGTNYFAHAIGSHPAECPPRGSCAARNNALVALLDLGEGWHNNHHAHPTYAHSGFYRWYQLDITYRVLLVLEQLAPETFRLIFRSTDALPISILSQLGLIMLMFQIGLEFDFSHLKASENRYAACLVSTVGILAPFGLGLGFGWVSAPYLAPG